MKLLGVVMAYNEADIVHLSLGCLLHANHDVHLFDHGSTDGTAEVARHMGATVHRVDRGAVPFHRLWRHISAFIRRQTSYDWVTWLAADEFLRQPDGAPLTEYALRRRRSRGICVIQPVVREFWPTDADPSAGPPEHRLRRYRMRPNMAACPRSWLRELTGNMPFGLHRPPTAWPIARRRITQRRWILDHYPLRTIEQARRKVLRERAARPYYAGLRRTNCNNLVRDHRLLEALP